LGQTNNDIVFSVCALIEGAEGTAQFINFLGKVILGNFFIEIISVFVVILFDVMLDETTNMNNNCKKYFKIFYLK